MEIVDSFRFCRHYVRLGYEKNSSKNLEKETMFIQATLPYSISIHTVHHSSLPFTARKCLPNLINRTRKLHGLCKISKAILFCFSPSRPFSSSRSCFANRALISTFLICFISLMKVLWRRLVYLPLEIVSNDNIHWNIENLITYALIRKEHWPFLPNRSTNCHFYSNFIISRNCDWS